MLIDFTYLVVLDGEKDEAVGVLLEKRLIGFEALGGRCGNWRRDLCLLFLDRRLVLSVHAVGEGSDTVIDGMVLLVYGIEVELLDGRLHFEGLNGSGSLL
jgi:hypothetical protein